MQLDHTRIVIRERGWLDLLDLALCLIRAYAWPLGVALAVGVAPAMAFNAWMLSGVASWSLDRSGELASNAYPILILLLTLWEIPMATAPATLFLGEAVFLERPSVKQIAKTFVRALPQLLVYQVLRRAFFIVFIVTWIVPFALRPYLNEVILLERNPMYSRRPDQMTTRRRNRSLHADSGSDLFARWLVSSAIGVLLAAGFWATMAMAGSLLLGQEADARLIFTLYYPLAIWLSAGYFAVVRFLGYLDLRIRREGWEVELLMRAEGVKLAKQLT
jgi:hypothetical protein